MDLNRKVTAAFGMKEADQRQITTDTNYKLIAKSNKLMISIIE